MEPAIIEMNVPVAIAMIIGMIGCLSWALVKNFENKFINTMCSRTLCPFTGV
jgi:hypothetical protein